MFSTDWLEPLTDAQRQAVAHIDGPLLVLAGPGSGKTRVVTYRIANLLAHSIPARQILALTFTNKAADEMRARVEQIAPGEPVWMSTFHRFCARLLRKHGPLVGLTENFTIYDVSDSQQALNTAIHESRVELLHYTPGQIATAISHAKNQMLTPENYQPRSGSPLGAMVAKVYPFYQKRLLNSSAVDFDDLLLHVGTLLRENPEVRAALDAQYRYILVDEYQDTNLAQYTIIRGLSIDFPNLAVTGDPDQSIYGWRGAQLSNILDFEHDYPDVKVVRLERNYRSTKNILHVADHLIKHNVKRKPKELYTENDAGPPVQVTFYATQRDEAEMIAARIADDVRSGRRRPRDFAVFYRTNALSRQLEFAFRDQGLPYQLVHGVEFYQRKEVKDVLAYLQVLNNPRDDVALSRIINTPARDIGKKTVERLQEHASHRGLTLLAAAREAGLIPGLSKRSAVAVAKFVALYDRLNLATAGSVEEVLQAVLTESRYAEQYQHSELEEDQDRLANLEELLTATREFDERDTSHTGLEGFLELASLVNDTDGWEVNDDRVTLMTLHAAKGLEFPCVFIVAVEEGLLPHERSRQSFDQLEEERRLLFVGITRAEQELQLSLARYREFRGQRRMTVPSQFLTELPRDSVAFQEPGFGGSEWSRGRAPAVDDFAHEENDDGPVFRTEPEPPPARSAPARSVRIQTAAELAGQEPGEMPHPVHEFHVGMHVKHPEYGIGQITQITGSGMMLAAAVEFEHGLGTKKFILEKSRLKPV